jgi:hypothetical protein
MLDSIITSETRIKLLMKFFLNPRTSRYLRQLSTEFGESTNGIRLELNKLSEAKVLDFSIHGRNKIYKANSKHPLFEDIRNIVLKSTGIDKVISDILYKLGNLELAFIRGDYAIGKDSGLIDLVIVGSDVNIKELERVRIKTEDLIARKISILTLSRKEFKKLENNFLNEPHLILIDNYSKK